MLFGMENIFQKQKMVGNLHRICNLYLFTRMIKDQLTAGYSRFASNIREKAYDYLRKYSINYLSIRHPNQELPAAFQQQYKKPFQPLLPNEIEPHSNFIAIQRVYTLPFNITIFVTQDTVQKGFFSQNHVYQQSSFEQAESLQELFQQRCMALLNFITSIGI